jgi:hypothetical protein
MKDEAITNTTFVGANMKFLEESGKELTSERRCMVLI